MDVDEQWKTETRYPSSWSDPSIDTETNLVCECGERHTHWQSDTMIECECGAMYAVTVTTVVRSPES